MSTAEAARQAAMQVDDFPQDSDNVSKGKRKRATKKPAAKAKSRAPGKAKADAVADDSDVSNGQATD